MGVTIIPTCSNDDLSLEMKLCYILEVLLTKSSCDMHENAEQTTRVLENLLEMVKGKGINEWYKQIKRDNKEH